MASESDVRRFFAETGRQGVLDNVGIGEATKMFESGSLADTRKGASGGGGGSVTDSFQEVMKLLQPSKDQAVGTLQARTPEREAAFGGLTEAAQGQKPTIEQRYKDTLEDITKSATTGAGKTLTARGIPLSSSIFDQIVQAQAGPQIGQAATQRDTNLLGIDQLLANIGFQKSQSGDALAQAIAAIQASTGSEGISAAQNIFSTNQSNRQADLNRQLQQQQLDLQKEQTESPYETLSEGQTLYNLLTGQAEYTAPKTYKPSDIFGGDPLGLGL